MLFDIVRSGIGQRTRDAAHRGRWADSLEMIRARHPQSGHSVYQVFGIHGRFGRKFEDGKCQDPTLGARLQKMQKPGTRRSKNREPNEPHHSWQKVASTRVNTGLMRPFLSQHSQWINHTNLFTVVQGVAAAPSPLTIPPPPPSPPSSRFCSCGRSLDVLGYHKACGKVGAEQERSYRGECCRPDLSRRRGQGVHQRHCERLGHRLGEL